MRDDAPTPVPATQRLELLDSLRGFALAGVLFANLTAFSMYFFLLSHQALLALPYAAVDRWLSPLDHVFVVAKFITLFSLLFGVGFSLQMQRNGDDRDGLRRYLRRLAVLFAIGLVHAYLFWWGDILRYYAVIGLLLLPARLWPTRALVVAGALLVIAPHSLFSASWDGPAIHVATRDQAYAAALSAFSNHDWIAMLRGNLAFNHWWNVAHWGQVTWVAGCLLIGTALGRLGVLAEPGRHALFWKRLLLWALPSGLVGSLLLEVIDYGRLPALATLLDTLPGRFASEMFSDAAVLALGLGYMAGFVVLFSLPAAHRWLRLLAPVGRMALSNYLAHSLIGITLFYGIGFDIGPRYGLLGVLVTWLLLFAAQVVFSQWWLRRFRFGPAEWLWRSLTYRRWQSMRITGVRAGDEETAAATTT